MNKEQQIVEFQNDIIDNLFDGGTYKLAEDLYNVGYRKETQFIENMKNVLEIEKKQAVKEFAEKIKNEVYPFLQAKMYDKKHFICGTTVADKELENQNIGILKAQDVLSQWFNIKIDELLKENE